MASGLSRRAVRRVAASILSLLSGCAAKHVIGSLGFVVSAYDSGTSGGSYASVAVADFDGDGYGDVAVVDGSQQQVCVSAGRSDGTLSAPRCQSISETLGAQFAVAGHFHVQPEAAGPPSSDLLLAGTSLIALHGLGDGTFALGGLDSLGETGGAAALAVGDVNRDGVDDPLIADRTSPTVSAWPTRGYGKFYPAVRYAFADSQRAIGFSDLDGDGRSELFGVSVSGVTVYGVHGVSPIAQCPAIGGGSSFGDPTAVAAIDGSGDGDQDLAVADSGRGGIVRLRKSGPLAFDCESGALWQASDPVVALLREDFDGDGGADLLALTASGDSGTALLIFSGSAYSAAAAPRYLLPEAALAGATGDLDGDGRPEAVALLKSGQLAVLRNVFGQ